MTLEYARERLNYYNGVRLEVMASLSDDPSKNTFIQGYTLANADVNLAFLLDIIKNLTED